MSITTFNLDGLNVRSFGPAAAPLAIVFLHHWGGTARTWDSAVQSLLKIHPNTRAVAYDSRGWGSSTKPEDDRAAYGLDRLAADAFQVVDGLEPQPKRVVLVGHSSGGKVAQFTAARWAAHAQTSAGFPALAGLILLSPGPASPSIIPEELAQQFLHTYDSAETIQLSVQHGFSAKGWEGFSEDVRKQLVEDGLSGGALAKEAWVHDSIPAGDVAEVVQGLSGAGRVPILVIAGELDKIHPVAMLESGVVAKLDGAKLVVFPDVGHLIPLEAEDKFVGELSAFIGKL